MKTSGSKAQVAVSPKKLALGLVIGVPADMSFQQLLVEFKKINPIKGCAPCGTSGLDRLTFERLELFEGRIRPR